MDKLAVSKTALLRSNRSTPANQRKEQQLGMSFGKACHRLRGLILFDLLERSGLNVWVIIYLRNQKKKRIILLMKDQGFKPKTLQAAIKHFSNEQTCIDAVALSRWPDGKPECPKCGGREHYYLASQRRWKCKNGKCGKQFSVKVGSIFEDSPLGLDKWMLAMWMIANCKNGVSSYEIHRAIGVTQKSAWFMLHRIRLAMQNGSLMKLGGKNGGHVEVDETYIGGKARFMHKDKRAKMTAPGMAKGAANKAIVAGFFERDTRKVRTKVIPDREKGTFHAMVKENVESGSQLSTDDCHSYWGLDKEYIHKIVDHAERYVDGTGSHKQSGKFLESLEARAQRNIRCRGTISPVPVFG